MMVYQNFYLKGLIWLQLVLLKLLKVQEAPLIVNFKSHYYFHYFTNQKERLQTLLNPLSELWH